MSAYGTERGAPTHDGNPGEASELPQPENLGFGRYLGAHLVLAEHDGAQWSAPGLLPREALRVPVASAGVQYGLSVFEGLKAYRGADGGVHLFRPQAHAHRFAASAARLGLPTVDEALLSKAAPWRWTRIASCCRRTAGARCTFGPRFTPTRSSWACGARSGTATA